MRLQLNFKSGKPVYLQIVDQVRAAVAAGSIRAGEPLPSIRPLAEEVDQAVVQAHHLQVTRAEFLKLVEERLDSFEEQRHRKLAT